MNSSRGTDLDSSGHRALVVGATGYTGRNVIEVLRSVGIETVAHVRPDTSRRDEWALRFQGLGAEVDYTPWDASLFAEAVARIQPTIVFALLGTTKKRARRETGSRVPDTYEAVDYGLTKMALDACTSLEVPPKFVYLSSLGVSDRSSNPYIAVRARIEADLRASGVPWLSVRPAFITGDDRGESRPLERAGAVLTEGALSVLRVVGARKVSERYRPRTGAELAGNVVRAAISSRVNEVVYPDEFVSETGS